MTELAEFGHGGSHMLATIDVVHDDGSESYLMPLSALWGEEHLGARRAAPLGHAGQAQARAARRRDDRRHVRCGDEPGAARHAAAGRDGRGGRGADRLPRHRPAARHRGGRAATPRVRAVERLDRVRQRGDPEAIPATARGRAARDRGGAVPERGRGLCQHPGLPWRYRVAARVGHGAARRGVRVRAEPGRCLEPCARGARPRPRGGRAPRRSGGGSAVRRAACHRRGVGPAHGRAASGLRHADRRPRLRTRAGDARRPRRLGGRGCGGGRRRARRAAGGAARAARRCRSRWRGRSSTGAKRSRRGSRRRARRNRRASARGSTATITSASFWWCRTT